jgi:hypothetical protein
MVIAAIDQGDADVGARQPARGFQPAETTAQDNDVGHKLPMQPARPSGWRVANKEGPDIAGPRNKFTTTLARNTETTKTAMLSYRLRADLIKAAG